MRGLVEILVKMVVCRSVKIINLEEYIVTIVIAYNWGAAIVIACHLAEERCYCHSWSYQEQLLS